MTRRDEHAHTRFRELAGVLRGFRRSRFGLPPARIVIELLPEGPRAHAVGGDASERTELAALARSVESTLRAAFEEAR
jgi:hypothetical protein